jgi:putative redox protein
MQGAFLFPRIDYLSIKYFRMETARSVYSGNLRTKAVHTRSGEVIITDAPPDNQGRGEYFSPTDLVATAFASCMMTVLGIAARTHGFDIDGTEAIVTKIMSAEPPRRISKVKVELNFPPVKYSDKEKVIIERIARTCPVALSLHPDLQQEIIFNFL